MYSQHDLKQKRQSIWRWAIGAVLGMLLVACVPQTLLTFLTNGSVNVAIRLTETAYARSEEIITASKPFVVTSIIGVNIKSCARDGCEVLASLDWNAAVGVIDEDENWYHVVLEDGRTGFVPKDALVAQSKQPTLAPTIQVVASATRTAPTAPIGHIIPTPSDTSVVPIAPPVTDTPVVPVAPSATDTPSDTPVVPTAPTEIATSTDVPPFPIEMPTFGSLILVTPINIGDLHMLPLATYTP